MNEEYRTRDLGTAAYIIAHGEVISRMEKEDNVLYFVFNNLDRCLELEELYRFKNGTVIGRLYFEALRQAKARIFEMKGETYGR